MSCRVRGVALFLAICSLLILATTMAQEEAKPVRATGMGAIIAGDLAHARDDAVEDALRRAVEQYVGTVISSETLVENFQVLEDKIYTKSSGYIQEYEVLEEKPVSEYIYQVTVEAWVAAGTVANDLEAIGILLIRKQMPRLMVIIEEQNVDGAWISRDLNTAESTIMEVFMAKGFRFVDQKMAKMGLSQSRALAAVRGDAQEAARLGRTYDAEVVIVGKAEAKVATGASDLLAGMFSCQANVSGVKAIRVDTKEIIATIPTEHAAAVHIDEVTGSNNAILEASQRVADKLMDKILDRWSADVSEGTMVTLVVNGVTSLDQVSAVKSALEYAVRGVKDIHQRSFSSDTVIYELKVTSNAQRLAEELTKKDLGQIALKVTDVSQNRVEATLERK